MPSPLRILVSTMRASRKELPRMRADQAERNIPRTSRDRTNLSPWVALETISVSWSDAATSVDVFHAFCQDDYVHMLAMTRHGLFVLVRQYRPVIARWTLEFPGGLREADEDPAVTAARELREETGFEAIEMIPLIECNADVGRLCNKFFGFFVLADRITAECEPGIKTVFAGGEELRDHAACGRLASSSHVGLLYLAAINPRVREICRQCGQPAVPWLA